MGKNLQRVSDMLDGTYKGKIQSGYTAANVIHKVGDIWTDLDGKTWEQKKGYRSSIRNVPNVGMFSKTCKDCGKNCSSKSYDVDTFKRMDRCYGCQTTFELDLKFMKIGKNGNKHQFWVRLQNLNRWTDGRKELEQWIDEQHKLKSQPMYTGKVANAMANANVSMEINKNKA
jgi:hypothetical protein